MINPKELRIGNYFRDRLTGRTLIVDSISAETIVFDQQGEALPDGWQAGPIPLNEEWLLKLGFPRYDPDSKWFFNQQLQGVYVIEGEDGLMIKIAGAKTTRITNPDVHNLQNLAYIWEGVELKIIKT